MKRYSTAAFIMIALIVLSACAGHKAEETQVQNPQAITAVPSDITIVPEDITAAPADTAEATEKEEGIWIKKYPGNYACFKFESPEGFQVVSDPYKIDETLQPDIVTESHQHLDHSDTANLQPPYDLITLPGEYKVGDVLIRGFAGKHNVASQTGSNNIFVITMNNITIAHFASQGECPDKELLEQIGTVDILLIQLFDKSDYRKLVLRDTDKIISVLQPKIIIPEHGDDAIGSELAKYLKTTEEVEASGTIYISRDMLDSADGIRVINLDNKGQ